MSAGWYGKFGISPFGATEFLPPRVININDLISPGGWYGRCGTSVFGTTEFMPRKKLSIGRLVACVGDRSSHGGTVISANTDELFFAAGDTIAVAGAMHACPLDGHGTTPIIPVISKTYYNGKLILTLGAKAGCGAVILPKNRKVIIE